jgi:hypothetical protein
MNLLKIVWIKFLHSFVIYFLPLCVDQAIFTAPCRSRETTNGIGRLLSAKEVERVMPDVAAKVYRMDSEPVPRQQCFAEMVVPFSFPCVLLHMMGFTDTQFHWILFFES